MELEEFRQLVPDLSEKSHNQKIKLFGWYLHVHKQITHFQPSDIGKCYDTLHIERPSQFGGYFADLVQPGKGFLKDKSGYRLESRVRGELDAQYGSREITIQVTQLLRSLPEKVPDLAEKTYLDEALTCFRHNAFRAAIVMTWNLAYHHLCNYVLKTRLDDFNTRWLVVYPGHHRKGAKVIVTMDDFNEELKESEVIEICNSAGIITKDIHRILKEKLNKRNSAAHPSSVVIGQLQVEAFIDDLINNVVLKLK
jgi:hypothetical protein